MPFPSIGDIIGGLGQAADVGIGIAERIGRIGQQPTMIDTGFNRDRRFRQPALPGGAIPVVGGGLIEQGRQFLGEAIAPGGGSICVSPRPGCNGGFSWPRTFVVPTSSGKVAEYQYMGTSVLRTGDVSHLKRTKKKLRKYGRLGGR